MQVFKFGGASIKDAAAIKNMTNILTHYKGQKLVVVVSAMGKTTNKLEAILKNFLQSDDRYKDLIESLYIEHKLIADALFQHPQAITDNIAELFDDLKSTLLNIEKDDINKLYDQIISYGERLSSTIISQHLLNSSLPTVRLNAFDVIKTDDTYREGVVNWSTSQELIVQKVEEYHKSADIILTQGFIGSNSSGNITTLGREGSDFTAAIYAYCLNAKSVTIWKDVPGILNADPKKIPGATLYHELSYQEAAEMTYYGASVIHPKTIKPLANKSIPLNVRSFTNPEAKGTVIHDCDIAHIEPCIIMKENQCLITFRVTDFTFISEGNISKIFAALSSHHIKINMMQNSAISFSICVNDDDYKLTPFIKSLKSDFDILYNNKLSLITIKNYQEGLIGSLKGERKVYLEQRTRKNYQMVLGM
ncbi:aspartate kinase [Marivirga atlantica]|jgi:aspartate kinase|uniref:Aspartokinase n=1 Tax=Marivirga atlantica TaxID=1548457 RepID=A0A937DKC2_9BACT|nr:aspartate kinase [Marivirga atlantica]MBL0766790.1 aspartate kinase [Marivirga atlantica]